jgi:hypothetical protein
MKPEREQYDFQSAAKFLNAEGIKTTTGREWTPASLRMFIKKFDNKADL